MSRMSDKERSPSPTPDELHERFKAALDRKAGKHQTSTPGGPGGGKASASTASTKRQREFRRKSGG